MNNFRFIPALIIFSCLTISIISCDADDDTSKTIVYPPAGFYGDNVLAKDKLTFTKEKYSFQANLGKGASLKIIITAIGDGYPTEAWYLTSPNNWYWTNFSITETKQTFESIDGGLTSVVAINFEAGQYMIDYYENGATTATSSKTIEVTE